MSHAGFHQYSAFIPALTSDHGSDLADVFQPFDQDLSAAGQLLDGKR
jgi:hypothetical protein